jgi:hypothetical protein
MNIHRSGWRIKLILVEVLVLLGFTLDVYQVGWHKVKSALEATSPASHCK